MQAAETAFYTPGQPKTYYVGSYYNQPKRLTQYDMWPDRQLDQDALRGKTVLFVGKGGDFPAELHNVFDKIEPLPDLDIIVRGVKIRTFHTWLGTNFRRMKRAGRATSF
jgi:hypothetical protein